MSLEQSINTLAAVFERASQNANVAVAEAHEESEGSTMTSSRVPWVVVEGE